jgi:hypothetical protein
MNVKLPVILQCDATECAYNTRKQCHAAAITVGDGAVPRCDTFWAMPDKGGMLDIIGEVGACRATSCRHNTLLECTATEGIRVGRRGADVDCLTFAAR